MYNIKLSTDISTERIKSYIEILLGIVFLFVNI